MRRRKIPWQDSVLYAVGFWAAGFVAAVAIFSFQVDRLAARQERLELLVGAVAPLRQMQAMAIRFERAGWEPAAASMIVAKIFQRARELHLDPLLVEAIIVVESARDTNAISPKGAKGLMQLMPVHLEPGEDPHEPILNIEKGTGVYAKCLKKSRGNGISALYRYNGSDPRDPKLESIDFARKVMTEWARLKTL
jgi:soluble lytic murein transglycosylase-like protein